MCPFKIGDIITCGPSDTDPYCYTTRDFHGEVVEVYSSRGKDIRVKIIKPYTGGSSSEIGCAYDVESKYFILVHPGASSNELLLLL